MQGALTQPFLYLSLFFKQHRAEYYELLQRVRTDGDWEGWMDFYLPGVERTARQAARTTTDLLALFAADRERVLGVGRSAATARRLYELLQRRVILSIPRATAALDVAPPTAGAALWRLESLGIVREITGHSYGRQYVYARLLEFLHRADEVAEEQRATPEPASAFETLPPLAPDDAPRGGRFAAGG